MSAIIDATDWQLTDTIHLTIKDQDKYRVITDHGEATILGHVLKHWLTFYRHQVKSWVAV